MRDELLVRDEATRLVRLKHAELSRQLQQLPNSYSNPTEHRSVTEASHTLVEDLLFDSSSLLDEQSSIALDLDVLRHKLEQFSALGLSLTKKYGAAKGKLYRRDETIAELNDLQSKMQNDHEGQVLALKVRIASLEDSVKGADTTVGQLWEENAKLRQDSEQRFPELEARIQRRDKHIRELLEYKDELHVHYAKQHSGLETRVQEKDTRISELTKLTETQDELLADYKSQIVELETELQERDKSLKEHTERSEELQLNKDVQIAAFESRLLRNDKMLSEITELRERLQKDSTKQVADLDRRLRDKDWTISELAESKRKLEADLETLERRIKCSYASLDEVTGMKNRLEAEHKRNIETLERKVQRQDERITELAERNQALEAEADSQRRSIQTMSEHIKIQAGALSAQADVIAYRSGQLDGQQRPSNAGASSGSRSDEAPGNSAGGSLRADAEPFQPGSSHSDSHQLTTPSEAATFTSRQASSAATHHRPNALHPLPVPAYSLWLHQSHTQPGLAATVSKAVFKPADPLTVQYARNSQVGEVGSPPEAGFWRLGLGKDSTGER